MHSHLCTECAHNQLLLQWKQYVGDDFALFDSISTSRFIFLIAFPFKASISEPNLPRALFIGLHTCALLSAQNVVTASINVCMRSILKVLFILRSRTLIIKFSLQGDPFKSCYYAGYCGGADSSSVDVWAEEKKGIGIREAGSCREQATLFKVLRSKLCCRMPSARMRQWARSDGKVLCMELMMPLRRALFASHVCCLSALLLHGKSLIRRRHCQHYGGP